MEVWDKGKLAGGIYGVHLGAAFFAESMFHRVANASKVALAALVERLRQSGFLLLDVQYQTPHLARCGAVEIPNSEYLRRLAEALGGPAPAGGGPARAGRRDCRFLSGGSSSAGSRRS